MLLLPIVVAAAVMTILTNGCKSGKQLVDEAPLVVQRVEAIYADVAKVYPSTGDELHEGAPFYDLVNLDSLYCSADWNDCLRQVGEADQLSGNEMGFFDADYWIMGQDWNDVHVTDVSATVNDRTHATVTLLLHNCGSTHPLKLLMVKEKGEWLIDDFLEDSGGEPTDWKRSMLEYVEQCAGMNHVKQ